MELRWEKNKGGLLIYHIILKKLISYNMKSQTIRGFINHFLLLSHGSRNKNIKQYPSEYIGVYIKLT